MPDVSDYGDEYGRSGRESGTEYEGRGLPKRRPESKTTGLFIRLFARFSSLKGLRE